MNDPLSIELPPVFEYQDAAIFCAERYAVIEGATKVGKTYPCILWLINEAGRVVRLCGAAEGRNYWWVAPTHEQAEIAYKRMRRMLMQGNPSQAKWKPQDQQKRITVYGLGEFHFKTGEEPDNLYGEDVYGAVMDEFTRQREEAWHALRSTLSATGARCRFIGNVKGRGNWGYRLARKAQDGDKSMHYAKVTATDAIEAGILTQDEVDDAERMLPHNVFRELYYAEPSDDGGNPFGLGSIAACVKEISVLDPVVFGVDLAKSVDWTVVVGLDYTGDVCRFERWQRTPWEETERRIASEIGTTMAIVDSTGVGDPIVERLQRSGLSVRSFKFTAPSKQQIMEGLAASIQGGEVGFPVGAIRNELETFEYEITRTGVRYSAPEGLHDDCVCALALAVSGMRRCQPLKVYDGTIAEMGPIEDPFLRRQREWAMGR